MTDRRVSRIVAIVLRSMAPDALARFYRDAFDFVDDAAAAGVRRLTLGTTRLWIEPAGPRAKPYPDDVPGWSPCFQHFALRVADVDAALARLAEVDGWRAISTDGPQRLPSNTGGVAAFKFRDPDGHPLEFLAFPGRAPGPLFAGIDHTAISVADVGRSTAFYEALGLVVTGRSLNRGIEQARLDGLDDPVVDVVGLGASSGQPPHLELLGYRGAFDRDGAGRVADDDVAATRIVFAGDRDDGDGPTTFVDPDGHRMTVGPAA